MMGRIFQAKLMTPADRRFKKAKPGKKKLVKWPKILEHADVRACSSSSSNEWVCGGVQGHVTCSSNSSSRWEVAGTCECRSSSK
jgi:hypothetical protein